MLDFTNDNDWNFEVEERPVLVEGLGIIEGKKALVRADTNTLMGVHSENYRMISHDEIVNGQYEAIKEANISSDFEFKVHCIDSGKKLKVEVLFNDLVQEPIEGDYVSFRATAFNSYDGAWAYQNQADGYRLACLNGMVSSDMISKVWARHTTNLNIENAAKTIKNSLEIFHNQNDIWKNYTKSKVERQDVEKFFKAKVVNMSQKSSDELFNKRQLNNLLGHYDEYQRGMGSNKWSVYNALTHWSTHTMDAKLPDVTTRYREKKVAEAMSSKMFAAI
jgi:hypothetical protein